MTFFSVTFWCLFSQCSALRFNVLSVLLLAQENWCIWPSRTRPPQTSSSALTARGRWLKWACFFTPHSASSTGRLSGNLLLHFQEKKTTSSGSFCIYILCSKLIVDILIFFFYPWPCLQVWFLCKSSDQTSPSSQSGSSFWQSQNAWGERSRGHSRHARRWACQSNMELKSKRKSLSYSVLYTHTHNSYWHLFTNNSKIRQEIKMLDCWILTHPSWKTPFQIVWIVFSHSLSLTNQYP